MKTIKTEINLFQYGELKGKGKERAFNEHLDFILSNPSQYENEKGEMVLENYDKWREEDLKNMVEDSLNVNEYWFFESGEMADCVTYTGKHEKAGITEFNFQNKVYEI